MSSTAALIDTAVERCAVWPVARVSSTVGEVVVVVVRRLRAADLQPKDSQRCSPSEVQRPRRLGGFAFPPGPHALT